MRSISLLSLLFISCNAMASFSKDEVRATIQTLASDEYEGRAPLTEGEIKTLHFLNHKFKTLGLKPLNGQTSYECDVPLALIQTEVKHSPQIGKLDLVPGKDITIHSKSLASEEILKNTDVVFVGYGISSPEWKWDDYSNLNVKGKIVVVLVNDPGFRGKEMTYFGRWTYKLEEAQRKGAVGAFIVHETHAAGYGWNVVSRGNVDYVIDENVDRPLKVHGWISEDAARKIFQASGKDFDQLKKTASQKPGMIANLGKFQVSIRNNIKKGISKNFCGFREGQSLPNEFVMVSAHWDHFGKKQENGKTEVFRGAVDNASGVAALLELARESSAKPKRSLLFCSFTAEEQGLVGAQYFASHPPIPLNQIKGMINMDSLNVGKETSKVLLFGGEEGKLDQLLVQTSNSLGREVVPDPDPEKGYFFRSDHYPFVKKGVPALLFLNIGNDPQYLKQHYHQFSDSYHPEWPLDGLIQDLKLFAELMRRLSN